MLRISVFTVLMEQLDCGEGILNGHYGHVWSSLYFMAHCLWSRLCFKCDITRAQTRFCFPTKRMSSFKSARASVHLTAGIWGVHISGSNAGYTIFWRVVKSTGYPLHLPFSPSLPLLFIAVCHHVSTALYHFHFVCRSGLRHVKS